MGNGQTVQRVKGRALPADAEKRGELYVRPLGVIIIRSELRCWTVSKSCASFSQVSGQLKELRRRAHCGWRWRSKSASSDERGKLFKWRSKLGLIG